MLLYGFHVDTVFNNVITHNFDTGIPTLCTPLLDTLTDSLFSLYALWFCSAFCTVYFVLTSSLAKEGQKQKNNPGEENIFEKSWGNYWNRYWFFLFFTGSQMYSHLLNPCTSNISWQSSTFLKKLPIIYTSSEFVPKWLSLSGFSCFSLCSLLFLLFFIFVCLLLFVCFLSKWNNGSLKVIQIEVIIRYTGKRTPRQAARTLGFSRAFGAWLRKFKHSPAESLLNYTCHLTSLFIFIFPQIHWSLSQESGTFKNLLLQSKSSFRSVRPNSCILSCALNSSVFQE